MERKECPVYCMASTNWTTCPVEEKLKDENKKLKNSVAHAVKVIGASVEWQDKCTCGVGRKCEPCDNLKNAISKTLI